LGTLVKEAWDEHLPDTDPKNKNRKPTESERADFVWEIEGPHWFEYYPGYPSKHFIQMVKNRLTVKVGTEKDHEKVLAGSKVVQELLGKTEAEIKENLDI
jgi:hypothetical protein